MSEPAAEPAPYQGRRVVRNALIIGLLAASALGATGRFRGALALALGTLAAVVTPLLLTGLVERLEAPRRGSTARLDWKFAFKAALRYAVVGLLLWGAVRLFPSEGRWLFAGVSTVVVALVVEGIADWRRGK